MKKFFNEHSSGIIAIFTGCGLYLTGKQNEGLTTIIAGFSALFVKRVTQ